MYQKYRRILILFLTGFIAFTAIIGGIVMLAGLENFPMEWIEGTIFKSYTIPALILSFVVGGSSLVAFILLLKKHRLAHKATMAAGVIMIGQIIGELIILKQEPPVPTDIEIFYFALGLIVLILGIYNYKK